MTQLDELAREAMAMPIAPPPTMDALRRRARRRTRSVVLFALVGVLVVGTATLGVLELTRPSHTSSRSIVANPGPDQTPSVPAPNFSPEQVDALVTPITPDDYLNGTRNLFDFQGRVNITLMHQCAAAHGYPAYSAEIGKTIGEMHGSFQHFDSPSLMRQFGYGVIADSVPVPPGKTPQDILNESRAVTPPQDVLDTCSNEVNEATARLSNVTNIFFDWDVQVINVLEASNDTMAQAWQEWGTCMSNAGYDVASGPPVPNVNEGGDSKFRSIVTNAMRAPGANAGAVEVELATIDANCLEQTVLPARAQVRVSARAQFIADHADAIRAAESDLSAAIQRLSNETGVPYSR